MKHVVEMGSRATIYNPSFTNIGSGSQKFMGGRHTEADCRSHKFTAAK
jgi:hypothetical protein